MKAYEDATGKIRDEYNDKKRTILEHITQLEQQNEYESGKDLDQPINRVKKRIAERRSLLNKAEFREVDMKEKVAKAKENLAAAEDAVKEAAENEKTHDGDIQIAQKGFKEAQTERLRVSKAVSAEEASLEQLRGKLHETLQKARVEEVDLPMLGSDGEPIASNERAARARRRSGGDGEEDEEELPPESSQQSTSEYNSNTMTQDSRAVTQFSQANNPIVMRDQHEASKVDFSGMRNDLKERTSDREEKKIKKDFEEKIAKAITDIENINPNMKVSEAK